MTAPAELVPRLRSGGERMAIRVGDTVLSHDDLAGAAGAVARTVAGAQRVAVETEACPETIVAVVGAIAAGVAVVPLNPKAGRRDRGHLLADCRPDAILARAGIDLAARAPLPPPAPDTSRAALVVYTSGTTGPPKGVVLSVGAIAANLDAVARAWAWTEADVVVHALPLHHVHGLVLASLGALRRGGGVHHVGPFAPAGIAAGLHDGGTMVFGVPTMWSRIAAAAEAAPELAARLREARLLVSGSAGLPLSIHARIAALTGRRVVERYGMTETLFSTAERAGTAAAPGSVGPPVDGVTVRIVDDRGSVIDRRGSDALGEIEVRGPNVFSGYLGADEATAAAFTADGFFRTGDIGWLSDDGALRITGRRSTDLIKTAGYRIGAGEIESVLLDHPAVAEVAVTGEPDEELGQRVVAWVVASAPVAAGELVDFVGAELAPHKRPREVRFVDALPRNDMGKVLKARLGETEPSARGG